MSTISHLSRPHKPLLPTRPKPYTPKPKGAKALTIAIGFECKEGYVLCADRQMSHGLANEYGSFAHYEKKVFAFEEIYLGAAICGAGNDGDLIKPLADAILGKIDTEVCVKDLAAMIEECLSDLAARLGRTPELTMLIAATGFDDFRFIKTDGLIIQAARPVEIFGIGEMSLVHYLTDSIFRPDLTLQQVAALGVWTIYAAKKYCPQYCGGQTDIYVLPRNYGWSTIPLSDEQIQALEQMFVKEGPAHLSKLVDSAATYLSFPISP